MFKWVKMANLHFWFRLGTKTHPPSEINCGNPCVGQNYPPPKKKDFQITKLHQKKIGLIGCSRVELIAAKKTVFFTCDRGWVYVWGNVITSAALGKHAPRACGQLNKHAHRILRGNRFLVKMSTPMSPPNNMSIFTFLLFLILFRGVNQNSWRQYWCQS